MAHAVARSVWLLPGETIRKDSLISGGRLLLTDYRLLFLGSVAESTWSIPTNLIAKVDVSDLSSLKFVSKLGLSFSCEFASEAECECWMDRIQQTVLGSGLDKDSFCFLFRDALHSRIPDHPFLQCTNKLIFGANNALASAKMSVISDHLTFGFNIVCAEFTRMKFGSPWRITHANKNFRICSSYPEFHIVPNDIEDGAISRMSEFRTHKRFPSVVWRSQTTGAVLLRTSEPRVGWMYNRNECDEQFMSSVSRSCMKDPGLFSPRASTRFLIVDARTFRVAQLKRFLGGGYEYSGYYNEAELCFMDMPNLHAVRVSFERLGQLYSMETDANWLSTLEKTCWLSYISQLLKSSLDIAVAMESIGRPVMVHCTDGWDRTAQLSSLAQLLADPYYRTIEGFVVLVEREWLQFGHKFADRCGQGDSYPSGDERSPIFLQWLDCVHQVRIQFPDQFEFNETFLVKLGLHLYSGMFGTFLCNSERSRQEADLDSRSCSVWALLSGRYNWTITNQFYEPSKERLLEPDWRLPSLRLWNSLYRSALLPSYRVSTGVVTLNNSANVSSALGESSSHVDQPVSASPCLPVPIHTTLSESHSGEVFSSSVPPIDVSPNIGSGMFDAIDENVTVAKFQCESPTHMNPTSDTSPNHTHSLGIIDASDTLALTNFANDSFSVFTNECELETRLSCSCDNLKDGPSPDKSVAILPISSVPDDTIQPPSLRNVRFLADFVSTAVESSRNDTLVAHSVSLYEGLPCNEQRSPFGSPCSRNCSISTNEDGGVFVVDDELVHSVPCTGVISPSRASHLLDRSCTSDDEEAIRWSRYPGRSSFSIDKTASPIAIAPKNSGSLCHAAVHRAAILASENPVEYQSLRPKPDSQLESPGVGDNSHDSCNPQSKAIVPVVNRRNPFGISLNHLSNTAAELSVDASDYTMHSLPEEELLLISETAADFGTCRPADHSPHAVSRHSSLGLCIMDRDASFPTMCIDSLDLSAWKGIYFTTHYLSASSNTPLPTHRSTAQQTAAGPCAFDSTQSLAINPDVHSASTSELRPVSAPTSPVAGIDLASRCQYVQRSSPVETTSPSTCTLSHVSPPLPAFRTREYNERPSVSRPYIDPVLLPFDWDGLPLSVDILTRRRHAREQLERFALERQVSDLTEKLRIAYSRLADAVAEVEQTKRIVTAVPALPSDTLTSITVKSVDVSKLSDPPNVIPVAEFDPPHAVPNDATMSHPLIDRDSVPLPPITRVGAHNSADSDCHTFELIDSAPADEVVHYLSSDQTQTDSVGPSILHRNLGVVFQPPRGHSAIPFAATPNDSTHCLTPPYEVAPQDEVLVNEAHYLPPVHTALTFATSSSEVNFDQADLPCLSSTSHYEYPALSTPLKLRAATGLLPTVSVNHLSGNMVSGGSSSSCRSAGGTRCATSPATPDGVAQA